MTGELVWERREVDGEIGWRSAVKSLFDNGGRVASLHE